MPKIRKSESEMRTELITQAFKIALIKKGWTQAHLAKLLCMDQSTVNRAINSPLKREFGMILRVADKLGVPLLREEVLKDGEI